MITFSNKEEENEDEGSDFKLKAKCKATKQALVSSHTLLLLLMPVRNGLAPLQVSKPGKKGSDSEGCVLCAGGF